MLGKPLQSILLIASFLLFASLVHSLPLSTSGRWLVDVASNRRVKLGCVNWVAHMQPMLAEGLDKKPLRDIVGLVSSLGFNCVRLTWATYMFTRTRAAQRTVAESLDSMGLTEAKAGVARNNPSLLNLTVVQAYGTVINELGAAGLMVVLDNHVSLPKWCCGSNDGNGFFGDAYFNPDEWVEGLGRVAKRFKGRPQVVGMSMRNELRGPRQNEQDWFRYIQLGARKIHKMNPDLLVIVSGLSYDTDLSFLGRKSLGVNFNKKLVYEAHWYSFSDDRRQWELQQPSPVCANAIRRFDGAAGFVMRTKNPVPLFVSEFGVDQRGVNRADNRFLSCFLAFAAERDLDWAMWALQGSYYLRNGRAGFEETYGVLDAGWDQPRNPKFQERFRLIQNLMQDPGSDFPKHYIMYHSWSGRCVLVQGNNNVGTQDCVNRSRWDYAGDGTPIRLMGTSLCLKAAGNGLPVILSTECSSQQSIWKAVSSSMLHLAASDPEGRSLCLENNGSNTTILTKSCLCLEDDSNCSDNPQIQWFKLIPTNVK